MTQSKDTLDALQAVYALRVRIIDGDLETEKGVALCDAAIEKINMLGKIADSVTVLRVNLRDLDDRIAAATRGKTARH